MVFLPPVRVTDDEKAALQRTLIEVSVWRAGASHFWALIFAFGIVALITICGSGLSWAALGQSILVFGVLSGCVEIARRLLDFRLGLTPLWAYVIERPLALCYCALCALFGFVFGAFFLTVWPTGAACMSSPDSCGAGSLAATGMSAALACFVHAVRALTTHRFRVLLPPAPQPRLVSLRLALPGAARTALRSALLGTAAGTVLAALSAGRPSAGAVAACVAMACCACAALEMAVAAVRTVHAAPVAALLAEQPRAGVLAPVALASDDAAARAQGAYATNLIARLERGVRSGLYAADAGQPFARTVGACCGVLLAASGALHDAAAVRTACAELAAAAPPKSLPARALRLYGLAVARVRIAAMRPALDDAQAVAYAARAAGLLCARARTEHAGGVAAALVQGVLCALLDLALAIERGAGGAGPTARAGTPVVLPSARSMVAEAVRQAVYAIAGAYYEELGSVALPTPYARRLQDFLDWAPAPPGPAATKKTL